MTNPVLRPRCPECGAQLRRGRDAGDRCDPCQRKGPLLLLPPDFYDRPRVAAALAVLNFGPVFLAIRVYADWSQQTLGDYLDMDRCRISDIEKGKRSLHDLGTAIKVANRIRLPAGRLGLIHGVAVGDWITTGRSNWMDRRDFAQCVATLVLGGVLPQLDIDRLLALVEPDHTAVRRVGVADVEALERATAEYERILHTYGGGYACEAATAHFRAILPLLNAQVDPAVRTRLHAATAHLALQAGYMSFDLEQHEIARRLWLAGLEIAQGPDDPVTTDLTAHICGNMARQALHLQRPDEALRLVRVGQAASQGPHQISPSTATALHTNLAFAYAAQGDIRHTERALGDAEQEFGEIDLATALPWACVDGPVKLITWQGHARYELGRACGNRDSLQRALPALIDVTGNPRALSVAMYLPDLAGAHALTGDIDTAVEIGHRVAEMAGSMHSRLALAQLRALSSVLAPMHTSPGVSELRERLHLTAA